MFIKYKNILLRMRIKIRLQKLNKMLNHRTRLLQFTNRFMKNYCRYQLVLIFKDFFFIFMLSKIHI